MAPLTTRRTDLFAGALYGNKGFTSALWELAPGIPTDIAGLRVRDRQFTYSQPWLGQRDRLGHTVRSYVHQRGNREQKISGRCSPIRVAP